MRSTLHREVATACRNGSSDVHADHEAAVRRAIAGMQAMLFEPLRLEHVAAAAIYSPFHFHRTFRQITSTTPARFLASLRMQRAKQLLADTDLTVTVISGLVGYESLGTFTTQFGRLVGTSPGRFRHLVDRCGTDLRLSDLDLGSFLPGRLPVLCSAPDGVRLECRTTIIGLFDGRAAQRLAHQLHHAARRLRGRHRRARQPVGAGAVGTRRHPAERAGGRAR